MATKRRATPFQFWLFALLHTAYVPVVILLILNWKWTDSKQSVSVEILALRSDIMSALMLATIIAAALAIVMAWWNARSWSMPWPEETREQTGPEPLARSLDEKGVEAIAEVYKAKQTRESTHPPA
jgi:hypothetical protein